MHKFWNPALALSLTHGIYGKFHSLLEPQFPHPSLVNEYSVSCSLDVWSTDQVSLVFLLAEAGGSSYPAPYWETPQVLYY